MSTTQRVGSAGSAHSSPDFFELLTRQGVLDPEEAGLRRRLVMSFLAFGLLLLGHVWVSMQSRNLGYQGEALGRLIHRLDQERVELEDAVARESRPALLASRAVELGMQKPGHGQLRRLGAGPGGTFSSAIGDHRPAGGDGRLPGGESRLAVDAKP